MRFEILAPADFAAALAVSPRPFLLDARSREDYETGHVPGARNVPVHDLARRQDELPRNKVTPVLIVGEPGKRTDAAAAWLVLMGWNDVRVLDGGIAGWTGSLETGPEPPPPPRWEPELRVIRD